MTKQASTPSSYTSGTPQPGTRRVPAVAFGAALALALLAFPEIALAGPWDGAADKVLEIFNGGLARSIAIISVIACGIAALAGKLSWDWAIKIIVGIVLIFGATSIVDAFKGAVS